MEIKRVGVAGCGLMGGGIAQVSAQAGFEVTVLEMEQRFLDKGLGAIGKNLARAVAKGKLEQEKRRGNTHTPNIYNKEKTWLRGCKQVRKTLGLFKNL